MLRICVYPTLSRIQLVMTSLFGTNELLVVGLAVGRLQCRVGSRGGLLEVDNSVLRHLVSAADDVRLRRRLRFGIPVKIGVHQAVWLLGVGV